MKSPYTIPKLKSYDDLSKTWYVWFRYEGKLIKKTGDINRISSKKDRTLSGNALAKALLSELKSGWNPVKKKQCNIKINRYLKNFEQSILPAIPIVDPFFYGYYFLDIEKKYQCLNCHKQLNEFFNPIHYFNTGFTNLNSILQNIATSLLNENPEINKEELISFLSLLSGVLNYQGFCLQQGIYKLITNINENDFRDKIIQHLIGNPFLGENINKESEIAGGRVEINYKGIVCELKVERKISNRKQIIKKYSKQTTAYSSGNTKQLSILCILDITEKNHPPASPLNNIFVITPKVHGFKTQLKFPSKQVVVIIDGNNKRPSAYSK